MASPLMACTSVCARKAGTEFTQNPPRGDSSHAAAPHQGDLNAHCSSSGSNHTLSSLVSSLSLNAVIPVSPISSVLEVMTYYRGM